MLAIPKMGLAKDLPGNSLAGSIPVTLSASGARDIKLMPIRIVHLPISRRRRSQCLAQRQHLVIAHYAATARDSQPFARCIVPAQPR